MLKVILSAAVFILSLSSCSYSQSQSGDLVVNKDYQDYLVKKQDLVLFEQARTAKELRDWK